MTRENSSKPLHRRIHGRGRLRRSVQARSTRPVTVGFSRVLERQIEDIMTQAAPSRRVDEQIHRVVSVLFVGISDYVGLCEQVGCGEVGALLDVYLGTISDSVGIYLGTCHNALGDIVMSSWNAAYQQADHATLAVHAALAMMERVEDINQRLALDGLPSISCSIGINTGDALIRHATLPRGQQDVVGDTVNIAQLLTRAAPAGTILLGEGTRVSIDDRVLLEALEPTTLPGKSKPTCCYRVHGLFTEL